MLQKNEILSVLNDGHTWNGMNSFGQPLTMISFSFFSELPSYYLADPTANILNEINQDSVQLLSSGQQLAFLQAFLAWKEVANINFQDAGYNNPNATIAVMGADFKFNIQEGRYFYASTEPLANSTAEGSNLRLGDIWINVTNQPGISNLLTLPGQDGFQTFLHEIGHALGLRHPGELAYSQNQLFTTMSYTKADITYGGSQWYPSAPMLYDIFAIQSLYGPNMGNHALDDSGQYAYTFSNDPNSPDVKAIWDAGGNDTFDASNQNKSVFINLNPGEFSSIGMGDRNKAYIAIAYNLDIPELANNYIENAIGGMGNDELIGNDADNRLEGGKGNDTLEGGEGNDTYVYTSGDGFDAKGVFCISKLA